MNGAWAGESSRCEDPAPTVGRLRGDRCGYDAPTIIYAHVVSTGTANGP